LFRYTKQLLGVTIVKRRSVDAVREGEQGGESREESQQAHPDENLKLELKAAIT